LNVARKAAGYEKPRFKDRQSTGFKQSIDNNNSIYILRLTL
jgi:hypothetical protein